MGMGVRAGDRYVVLVAGEWDAGEELPGVEMVRCQDVDEAMAWLLGSRLWSAVVADPRHRALVEVAARRGVAVAPLPVSDLPGWLRDRAGAVRAAGDLGRCGPALSALWRGPAAAPAASAPPPCGRALVTVCGPGGTGASTVAMAVAAGLAGRGGPGVLLADLALRAGQAVLHQVPATSIGLEEFVHTHRSRRLTRSEVRAHTVAIDGAAYRLMVGLHRPSHWTAIRPAVFDAALESLRDTFSVVVADVTGDLEGEAETGSDDVEERNHMARRTVASSDIVVVVGAAGRTSQMALDATFEAVVDHIGDASRVVKVLNRIWPDDPADPDMIAVSSMPASADLVEWGGRLTDAIVGLLSEGRLRHPPPGPTLVAPRSIGHWSGAR
jgi:MinD-like ATPase involved in chromosome partitioning or flagellar assembly